MRNAIPLVNPMSKLISALDIPYIKLILKYEVSKDNKSTITLAKAPSILPRTKHVKLKYYHFRQFVLNGLIDILCAQAEEQIADIFTKPLPSGSFTYLRYKLIG